MAGGRGVWLKKSGGVVGVKAAPQAPTGSLKALQSLPIRGPEPCVTDMILLAAMSVPWSHTGLYGFLIADLSHHSLTILLAVTHENSPVPAVE